MFSLKQYWKYVFFMQMFALLKHKRMNLNLNETNVKKINENVFVVSRKYKIRLGSTFTNNK